MLTSRATANVATARSAVFESLLCAVDDGSRGAAALALAQAAAWLPDDDRGVLVEELGSGDGDADEREGRALALSAIARTSRSSSSRRTPRRR